MPRMVRCGLALTLAIALAAPRARASGYGGGGYYSPAIAEGLAIGALVIGGTDLTLTFFDLASLSTGQRRSIGYGVLETLVAAPQIWLGVSEMSQPNPGDMWTAFTLWTAALAAHGIWCIVAGLKAGPPREPPPAAPEPALRIGLGPTYAPVGQFSHPGFGLVGHF